MPIFPCFDPTTGASGGASGGGGGSLYDVSMGSAVNLTDGSWTLSDPDSLVDSVSFSGGFNTVTMNALAAGASHYRWDSSATNNNSTKEHVYICMCVCACLYECMHLRLLEPRRV